MFVTIAVLGVLAALPSAVLCGLSASTAFVSPLVGGIFVSLATELELWIGLTFLTSLGLVSVAANIGALAWLIRSPSRRRSTWLMAQPGAGWAAITVLVLGVVMLWPLHSLSSYLIGYDPNAVWLLHGILIHGGHSAYVSALTNPAFGSANMDYPPLVPGSEALGFFVNGGVNLHLGVGITALLNACGLGALGSALCEVVGRRVIRSVRVAALLMGSSLCLVGFGVAGQFGITGFADLAWASAAAAGAVFGLVLPLSPRHFWLAWLCLTAAGFTKNEGYAIGVPLIVLMVARYTSVDTWRSATGLGRRAAAAAALALPNLTWPLLMRSFGVGSAFFQTSHSEPPLRRVGPTIQAASHFLHIAPVAVAVLVVGSLFLRVVRSNHELGNPAWFWGAVVVGLGILFGTYVFGSLEIHYWLASSLNRTMIFPQLLLYTDIALWAIVALLPERASWRRSVRGESEDQTVLPDPVVRSLE